MPVLQKSALNSIRNGQAQSQWGSAHVAGLFGCGVLRSPAEDPLWLAAQSSPEQSQATVRVLAQAVQTTEWRGRAAPVSQEGERPLLGNCVKRRIAKRTQTLASSARCWQAFRCATHCTEVLPMEAQRTSRTPIHLLFQRATVRAEPEKARGRRARTRSQAALQPAAERTAAMCQQRCQVRVSAQRGRAVGAQEIRGRGGLASRAKRPAGVA